MGKCRPAENNMPSSATRVIQSHLLHSMWFWLSLCFNKISPGIHIHIHTLFTPEEMLSTFPLLTLIPTAHKFNHVYSAYRWGAFMATIQLSFVQLIIHVLDFQFIFYSWKQTLARGTFVLKAKFCCVMWRESQSYDSFLHFWHVLVDFSSLLTFWNNI